jgi:uncharacterized protein (TIGR03067 family)
MTSETFKAKSKLLFGMSNCLRLVTPLLIALIVAITGCVTEATLTERDRRDIEGKWQLVYQQINGKKLPDEEAAQSFNATMLFTEDTIRYTADLPGFEFQFRFSLHPSHNPRAIDLVLTQSSDGQNLGKHVFRIYRLRADSLEIAFNEKTRPEQLSSEPGSHNTLVVLSRPQPDRTPP